MPKVSRETGEVVDLGPAEERNGKFGGYTVNFISIRQDSDLAPLLAGLPGGRCPCSHWGYLFKGRMTVRYADHEEVIEPGDAFLLVPGHVPAAIAGTEFVQFSPTEELAAVEAAMAEAMKVNSGPRL
jgi:hypothetical protein